MSRENSACPFLFRVFKSLVDSLEVFEKYETKTDKNEGGKVFILFFWLRGLLFIFYILLTRGAEEQIVWIERKSGMCR